MQVVILGALSLIHANSFMQPNELISAHENIYLRVLHFLPRRQKSDFDCVNWITAFCHVFQDTFRAIFQAHDDKMMFFSTQLSNQSFG